LSDSQICFSTAVELLHRIHEKELSARELMEAHLSQIERLNPELNAIVTLHPDRALEGAKAADERQAHGEALGPLHGLPIAHKDLVTTRALRSPSPSPEAASRLRCGGISRACESPGVAISEGCPSTHA
jgi:amidase